MWQVVAMMGVGAYQGAMAGDAIMDEAELSAEDLELEGARVRRNALGEAKDIFVQEELSSGADQASETANNISSGMSEMSVANQMLRANQQSAMRESQAIIDEGNRMNDLYKNRAKTTRKVGKERAEKALVNGIVGGAVSGYGMKE